VTASDGRYKNAGKSASDLVNRRTGLLARSEQLGNVWIFVGEIRTAAAHLWRIVLQDSPSKLHEFRIKPNLVDWRFRRDLPIGRLPMSMGTR